MKERSISTLTLDGGCLCFDFANTVSFRMADSPHEYIRSYSGLLEWCRKTQALPRPQLDLLEKRAAGSPAEAEAALDYFLETREALYRFFSALAAKSPPGEETILSFNAALEEAMQRQYFNAEKFPARLEWKSPGHDLKEPAWAAFGSAWDILYREDQGRIKECEACSWLFLDRTKNNRKRWCNPAFCGSADKAKRYYQRRKQQSASGSKPPRVQA